MHAMRGAECGTDHKLLLAKLKFRIRKKVRSTGTKVPKRIDVAKLQNSDVRESLSEAFESAEFDGTWEQFKSATYKIGVDVLGLKKRKHRDWFDENHSEINNLLETRRYLHLKLLNTCGEAKKAAETSLKENKAVLQRELRRLENK